MSSNLKNGALGQDPAFVNKNKDPRVAPPQLPKSKFAKGAASRANVNAAPSASGALPSSGVPGATLLPPPTGAVQPPATFMPPSDTTDPSTAAAPVSADTTPTPSYKRGGVVKSNARRGWGIARRG